MRNALNRRVVVATSESDAHVVALSLLDQFLTEHGFAVHNLGVCTPSREIAQAAAEVDPCAVCISAQNGHALKDLAELASQMEAVGAAAVPVFVGGNLSVGADKDPARLHAEFARRGLRVLASFEEVLEVLAGRLRTDLCDLRAEAMRARRMG
jgi:methylaspartate mutase sigma subunit